MSLINIVCIAISPNPRTAAIYYFITALFMLLACFDTYFALPLNVRYRDLNILQDILTIFSLAEVLSVPRAALLAVCQ